MSPRARPLMQQLLLDLFGFEPAPPARPPAPAGQALVHPQSNRAIVLQGSRVAYAFRRGRRRTIGLSVDEHGLTVSAPRWTPLAEVEAMLHEKTRWVLDRLAEAQRLQAQAAAERIVWHDGAALPYLGGALTLRLDIAPERRRSSAALDPRDAAVLWLRLPEDAQAGQVRDLAQAWLMRQARQCFSARLDHFAPQLAVRWRRLTLSSARTRWGSAGANGTIALNWRLIHLSQGLIDYVVVHELAHLHEMNHGARFWAHVQAVLPDHAARRAALRQVRLAPW